MHNVIRLIMVCHKIEYFVVCFWNGRMNFGHSFPVCLFFFRSLACRLASVSLLSSVGVLAACGHCRRCQRHTNHLVKYRGQYNYNFMAVLRPNRFIPSSLHFTNSIFISHVYFCSLFHPSTIPAATRSYKQFDFVFSEAQLSAKCYFAKIWNILKALYK